MDLPIDSMVNSHSYVNVYQRVFPRDSPNGVLHRLDKAMYPASHVIGWPAVQAFCDKVIEDGVVDSSLATVKKVAISESIPTASSFGFKDLY